MTEPWPSASAARTTASTSAFLTTFGLVLVAITGFLAIDLWLARIDSRESALHAAHLFEDGETLLRTGKPREAADRFASAQALERTNVRYGVALAEAMLADGRVAEAEAQIRRSLGGDETDGAANLVMARTLVREGRPDAAASYYHRAIYGSWDGDPATRQLGARLELIDLLVRQGLQRELLAELLPLQDVEPDSIALRRRLGHLFLLAGSPEHAIPIFRELLKRDSRDGDAYAGMGEAALALGNFRTARADLVIASHLIGDSARVAGQLEVADSVLAIDPTARGIGASTRLDRSRTVLRLTVDATASCVQGGLGAQLADSARRALARPAKPPARANETDRAAESLLDLASELWSRRGAGCRTGGSATRQALALIQMTLPR